MKVAVFSVMFFYFKSVIIVVVVVVHVVIGEYYYFFLFFGGRFPFFEYCVPSFSLVLYVVTVLYIKGFW